MAGAATNATEDVERTRTLTLETHSQTFGYPAGTEYTL